LRCDSCGNKGRCNDGREGFLGSRARGEIFGSRYNSLCILGERLELKITTVEILVKRCDKHGIQTTYLTEVSDVKKSMTNGRYEPSFWSLGQNSDEDKTPQSTVFLQRQIERPIRRLASVIPANR
jgi:hypothetical protein